MDTQLNHCSVHLKHDIVNQLYFNLKKKNKKLCDLGKTETLSSKKRIIILTPHGYLSLK